MCNSLVQATAGEEEEEEGAEDEKGANLEKERASLMHATSGSGMHAIEVRLCTISHPWERWGRALCTLWVLVRGGAQWRVEIATA